MTIKRYGERSYPMTKDLSKFAPLLMLQYSPRKITKQIKGVR